jgi:CRP/FNR family cyclic AMP-dependent transcriptional regulator
MATVVSTAVLKTVPLFISFPEDYLRTLATVVTRRGAPRSTTIMASGDAIDSLYMILSGRLKVMMSDSDGKEVILSILGPGEFFGEMGLIDDAPRSASVVTIEPCGCCRSPSATSRSAWPRTPRCQAVMRGPVRRPRGPTARSAAWRCSTSTAGSPACCSTWRET